MRFGLARVYFIIIYRLIALLAIKFVSNYEACPGMWFLNISRYTVIIIIIVVEYFHFHRKLCHRYKWPRLPVITTTTWPLSLSFSFSSSRVILWDIATERQVRNYKGTCRARALEQRLKHSFLIKVTLTIMTEKEQYLEDVWKFFSISSEAWIVCNELVEVI